MNSRHLARWAVVLSCLAATFPLFAVDPKSADWPQFRGPNRNDVSEDKGLLKEWPKDGPAQVWKCEGLGVGFSSVAVVGDRVYTMGDLADGCNVIAIDRAKGEIVWKTMIGKTGGNFAGPRCTPTVDGDSVYAIGQFGDFVCLDAKDGSARWKKNFGKDFKGEFDTWNYTESPLVDGDKVVVTPGGTEATMLAMNKKTGDVIWKGVIAKGEKAAYSSIVVAEFGGKRQYIQLIKHGLASFSADKGELLWRYGTKNDRFGNNTANIPTPIVKGNQVFASVGYGRGAALVTVNVTGEKFDVSEDYWKPALKNKHGGVINVGDYLFGDLDDSGRPWCADFKTGEIKWSKKDRTKGGGSASLTYADGMLYIHYANGWVVLVNPETGTEVSEFKPGTGKGNLWAHPVVVGGKLYIREEGTLFVFDVKAK